MPLVGTRKTMTRTRGQIRSKAVPKSAEGKEVPNVPHNTLTSLDFSPADSLVQLAAVVSELKTQLQELTRQVNILKQPRIVVHEACTQTQACMREVCTQTDISIDAPTVRSYAEVVKDGGGRGDGTALKTLQPSSPGTSGLSMGRPSENSTGQRQPDAESNSRTKLGLRKAKSAVTHSRKKKWNTNDVRSDDDSNPHVLLLHDSIMRRSTPDAWPVQWAVELKNRNLHLQQTSRLLRTY